MKNRKQVIELFAALTTSVKKGNAKFKYAILKNTKLIESEIESLKAIEKEIEETVSGFNEKRNEIIRKYGKEADGVISITPDSENFETAVKELEALQIEFKDQIELQKSKVTDYESLLNESVDFAFALNEITIENVPDDITDEEMKQLMDWEIVL